MARPKKHKADYFPHLSDLRNDRRIKALRQQFPNGYAIYCMTLEVLASTENFRIPYTDAELLLLSGDFGFSVEEIKQVYVYAELLGLLKINQGYVYSSDLEKLLEPLMDKRKKMQEVYQSQKQVATPMPQPATFKEITVEAPQPYLVTVYVPMPVPSEEAPAIEATQPIEIPQTDNNRVSASETPISASEMVVSDAEIPQSKEKERKDIYMYEIAGKPVENLETFFQKNFQILSTDLKLKHSEIFFNACLKEFAERNIQGYWKNAHELRKHFVNFLYLKEREKQKEKNVAEKKEKVTNSYQNKTYPNKSYQKPTTTKTMHQAIEENKLAQELLIKELEQGLFNSYPSYV